MVYLSRNTTTHSILSYLDDLYDACREQDYDISIIDDVIKYDYSVKRAIANICRIYEYYLPVPNDDFLLIWENHW